MEDTTNKESAQNQQPQSALVNPSELQKVPVEEHSTASRSHKGLIMAAIIALAIGIVGVSVFIGFSSSGQYQGYIKKFGSTEEKIDTEPASIIEVKTSEDGLDR